MIGTSSYVTSMKKGRAIGGCLCSGSGGGGVTSLNGETGGITILGTGDTTVTTVGPVFTINSTGGSGGSFLPLAGGTMTGVSGAPISNVQSITGPVLGDLSFKTVSGNINIDTSGRVQIGGPVVIQPPIGYTYPESISGGSVNIATQIKDWVNTNPSGSTVTESGLVINNIASANGASYGMAMESITSTTKQAYGIFCGNISGATGATGGSYNTITSPCNATGLNISTVTGNSLATGISVNNITSTTTGTYGVYIGTNLSGPIGSNFGFYQEGNIGGDKIVNNMMNELRCGAAEDPITGTSFKVTGNAFYSAQYPEPDTAIIENSGNLVLLKNTGGDYKIILPTTFAQEGHQYTICMRNTANVIFTTNNGGANVVNGEPDWICPGIPAGPPNNYRMLQAFFTSIDSVSGEWYIG